MADKIVPMAQVRATNTCFDEYTSDWSRTAGASVCWRPSGDIAYICDTASDGHHPTANFYYKGRYSFVDVVGLVNGECYVHDTNLDEGRDFDWQAENWEGNRMLNQGSWIDGYT